MPTKISRYCEGILEAAWLTAILVVPLFFNIYSSRIFEPDKISLLRSLGLVILAAWLVKIIEEGEIRWKILQPKGSLFKSILRIPFIAPVLGLAAVYLIATLFSVNPGVSLWGSYQRLQGTYTTFSYMLIFAAIAGNLRRQVQVERLISVVILTSLPVSFYGILQHYHQDPIPWGGDVTLRIAANMGNSIFLAAYLIMVNPFTVVRIITSFRAILTEQQGLFRHLVRATAYVFIAALQLIALYFTGSRGPWLGWMAGSFFLFVLLTLYWRKRRIMLGVMLVALLAGIFLIVLNIPNGPLESLRGSPRIARLGHLLNAESDTGRVRVLIWQGAAELVAPHQPLEYPDGREDPFNALRSLIGYGPESMYVAFNPFYPPELGQIEKRNATPDRSHNETWDSLVTTGVLGLAVYLVLFAVVFYYGLKWLGLINTQKQRNLFLALYIGGGGVAAVSLVLWRGIAYFGIGLPFGMIGGVIVYLTLAALFGHSEADQLETDPGRALTLVALLAVMVAHFAEIHFGIAIVATRTYFWIFAGLLLVIGYIMPLNRQASGMELGAESQRQTVGVVKGDKSASSSLSKKKRRAARPSSQLAIDGRSGWLREALAGGLIVGVILATLGFNYISNAQAAGSPSAILWASLIQSRVAGSGITYGIFTLIFIAWFFAALILAAEKAQEDPGWWKNFAAILGSSAVTGLLFWLMHAGALAGLANWTTSSIAGVLDLVGQYEGLLAKYYVVLLMLILALAACLPTEWPSKTSASGWLGAVFAPLVVVLTLFLISYTNLRTVQADIAFKWAEPYTRQNSWPAAISIYKRANELAPAEDYYYLFLGRAYIEYSKTITDPDERDGLITQAERDLRTALMINPLNTDHTANLARLYSLWASYATDPEARATRANISSEYFSRAIVLSPNNARLWDEWAILFLEILNQPDEAHQRLMQAMDIDPAYDWTYGLLAQHAIRTSEDLSDQEARKKGLEKAAYYYEEALKMPDTVGSPVRYNYYLTLGSIYTELSQPQQAIAAYEEAARLGLDAENRWRLEEAIAQLYTQMGNTPHALDHFNLALSTAPDDQKDRIQTSINQLETDP